MRVFVFLATMVLLLASSSHAQTDESGFELGPRLTLGAGDLDDVALGGALRIGSPSFPLRGSGAFDVYLSEENASTFTVDLNAHIPFDVARQYTPYFGAGLGITRVSGLEGDGSTTDLGLNVVGGAEVDLQGVLRPFVQAQLTLGDMYDRIGFTGGLLFDI